MYATATYIWHDGEEAFDQVITSDRAVSRTTARALAFRKLLEDVRATRVQVHYGLGTYEEASRLARQVRRLRAQAQLQAS